MKKDHSEHWLIYDRSDMPKREKNENWERFINDRFLDAEKLYSNSEKKKQKYENQAKRVYFSMPGNMYPIAVMSLTQFKPKKELSKKLSSSYTSSS